MITQTAQTIDAQISTVTYLLCKYNLTADEQITIENTIGLVATQHNWTRQKAAWYLHRKAFPELY